jgi:5-deoxy-glucuronate isomerase
MTPLSRIDADSCIVRNTAASHGRTRTVMPGLTAMRELHYGRIILDGGDAPVTVNPGALETGLICLKGRGRVKIETAGREFDMEPYDALYIPHHTTFVVTSAAEGVDFAELAAPVSGKYPLQFVRFADVQRDPGLHFAAGGPASERTLNILIGKNVEAGRILAGVTFSRAGNWTSWPPHEHGTMLEEAYLYIDMPAPAFGVQLVYTDKDQPELATIVHEGDVVLMPEGYHPNVAAPGGTINFLWMMAAHRERDDRQFGVVNVHPDYAAGGSGLDPGKATAR